jgi:GTP pyrophosphokinase
MRLQRKDMQLITNGATPEGGLDVWLNLLKEALENSQASAVDFVEDFKMNLLKGNLCFTPKEILSPYKGSFSGLRLAYIQK